MSPLTKAACLIKLLLRLLRLVIQASCQIQLLLKLIKFVMTTEETKKTEQTTAEDNKEIQNDADVDNDADDKDENGQKTTKGEKKFKKAIARMGMKPVDGIDYVTLKTQKDVGKGLNLVHYVHRPA